MSGLFFRVYAVVLAALLAATLTGGLFFRWSLENSIDRHLESIMSIPARALARELNALPPGSARDTRLAEMQADLGFPVKTISSPQDLDTAQRLDLESGRALVRSSNFQQVMLVRLADGQMLSLGPLPSIRPAGNGRGAILLASVLLALVGAIFLLVRPIDRRLLSLAHVARDLGNGNLKARAPVRDSSIRGDTIDELGTAFNQMAERIEGLIQSQQDLLRAVAHELANPIARLRFAIDLLSGDPVPDSRRKREQLIEADLAELDELVRELLTLGRLEAGVSTPQRVELGTILDDLPEKLQALRPQVRVTAEAHPDQYVLGEPRLLRRAVSNLAHNALRHAQGQVKISSVSPTSRAGDRIQIIVDDDGPGVPAEHRTNIFSPFVRLDPSRSRDTGGTGLGLAIVEGIAKAHDGNVTVSDSPMGGARFILELPAVHD